MSVVEYRGYSVLMSVYHKEKPEYLKQAIESIQAQTLSTNDFVLVCDGPLNEQLDGVIATKQQEMGDTLNVVRLHGEGAVKRRIMDMGVTKGVLVYIRKVAPLGDPIEVTVRGYELSLRKADAEMVEVE